MKELVIISGKGGSGKTSVSSSFISLAADCTICDCDVEAPNLHILLKPQIQKTQDFYGLPKAVIDLETCIKCDICTDACRFSAIKNYIVDDYDCEGCTFCRNLCPVSAIDMVDHVCGQYFYSQVKYGTMFHARLGIGEQNSGRLVSLLRKDAAAFAGEHNQELIITDGPPGIGCPTIASLSGTSMAVIITEPTMSAVHDLLRTIDLCRHFRINFGIIINKCDLNPDKSCEIRNHCEKENIPIWGEIPFNSDFREAVNNCIPPVEYSASIREIMQPIWATVKNYLDVV